MTQKTITAEQLDLASIAAYFGSTPTAGVVSSVGVTAGTGISVTGTSPITSSGSFAIGNTGVTALAAGSSNITVSAATGNITADLASTITGLTSVSSTTFVGALTGNASSATDIAGGTANEIPYQTSAGVTAFLAQGSGVLQEMAGAPAWTTTPTLTGTNFTGIPNAALSNSSVTLGSTSVSLGATATTLAGLTSVTSTTFVGSLTGSASLDLPLAGGTLSGALILAGDPSTSNQAATKNYVDNAINGLSWKEACAVASVGANLTLSGEQTIDGVTTSASRILVKDQTDATTNGIYVTAAGAWARSSDADSGGELNGAAVYVDGGTVNAGTAWTCTDTGTITIGSTSIFFAQFGAGATYVAGSGLTLTGNSFSLTNSSLTVNGVSISLGGSGTVAAAAGTLTGTTLASNVVSSSLASVGTIVTGVWNGTPIANANLANSSITVNGTSISLGGSGTVTASASTLTGTTLASNVVTSSLTTVGTIGTGVWNGTPIANANLANSSVTIGSTSVSLGATVTTIAGLTLSSPTFTSPALGTPASGTLTNCTFPTLNQNTTGSAGSVANAITVNSGGSGASSGATFNGSAAVTISYNTVGAPSVSGTNATGTWGISITGNAATATSATSATTATNQSGGTVSATTGVFSSTITVAGQLIRSATTGYLDGGYNGVENGSTAGCIYTIGSVSYRPNTTSTNALGTTYGVGYTTAATTNGNGSTISSTTNGAPTGDWGFYVAAAGTASIFLDGVSGGGYFGGTVTASSYNSTSDRTMKMNLRQMHDATSILSNLTGYRFDWKKDGTPSVGLMAQEVEAVLPELVATDDNGKKSLNYAGMVGVLVEGFNQLRAEMKARIDSLEAEVARLTVSLNGVE